jgi:hypothetical protein
VAVEVTKPPNEALPYIVDLKKWWPEEFIGENIKLNSEFVLKTGEGHYSKNKVIEFVPNEKAVYLVYESRRKEDNCQDIQKPRYLDSSVNSGQAPTATNKTAGSLGGMSPSI